MTLLATHPVVEQCPSPVDGKCPGHTPNDAEYRAEPTLDPRVFGFDQWTSDQFNAVGAFFFESWRAHMRALQKERDLFFGKWEAEKARAESREAALCRIATGFERHTARELGEWAVTELEK